MADAVFYNIWSTASQDDQRALLDAMRKEAPGLQAKPGFLSLAAWAGEGNDHRVVVQGRWASRAAFEAAVTNDPSALESRDQLAAFGTAAPGSFTEAFRLEARDAAVRAENDAQASGVTFIQVWSMEAEEHQWKWLEIMHVRIGLLARQPGFRSMSLHTSLDGKQTAVYAQWEDEKALAAAVSLPEAEQSHDEMARWGTPVGNAYRIASVYLPDRSVADLWKNDTITRERP